MGLAMVLTTAGVIALLSIARLVKSRSSNANYFQMMEKVYTLAESGLNTGISKLSYDPSECGNPSFSNPVTVGPGKVFQNTCSVRTQPQAGAYYIVTSASITVQGRTYSQRLHSYVSVSNVADYFAAVNGTLQISHPADISGGKVYATDLIFDITTDPNPTQLEKAEFVKTVTPALSLGPGCPSACNEWSAGVKAKIAIAQPPATQSPTKLAAALLFPQITPADITRYLSIATYTGNHRTRFFFTGNITPPGYSDYVSNMLGDTYPGHTTDNREHVYFSTGDISVRGNVFGQVLFVAAGDIYISGDLTVDTGAWLPGAGSASSSTAHQCILIPGPNKRVIIRNNFYDFGAPGTIQTQRIEALVMALSGALYAQPYSVPGTNDLLKLQYKGSMILGGSPDLAPVYNCFAGGTPARVYTYDTSLKINPPPYLPALSVVHNEFQEVTSPTRAFN